MSRFTLLTFFIATSIYSPGYAGSSQQKLEYPYYLVDTYSPDNNCWRGMSAQGIWPVPVIPAVWLVGPPPSEVSGTTLLTDYWFELRFRGIIIDEPGDDIYLRELGQCGEQARVFLVNDAGQELPLGIATAMNAGIEAATDIGFDISGIPSGFEPYAVRIVALDMGGGLPGFDLGDVRAITDRSCSLLASWPNPVNNAGNVATQTALSWFPGCFADKHKVYFGDFADNVETGAAPVSSPPQPQDANSFTPPEYELGKTYFWRIDEVNNADANNIQTGNIWKYTITDSIILDNFEFYNKDDSLHNYWHPYGWITISIEEEPVHRCFQSMRFDYESDAYYPSEAVLSLDPPQDWISLGAKTIELFFYGSQNNDVEGQLYFVLSDGSTKTTLPYTGDVNNIREPAWNRWLIDLTTVADVNLVHIDGIGIGYRNIPDQPGMFNSGTIYFDDVIVYPSRCLEENRPAADFNGDCIVDSVDLEEMSQGWLQISPVVYQIKSPREPLARYEFNKNLSDTEGSTYGESQGNPLYVPGIHNDAIKFDGQDDRVTITGAANLFSKINQAITISFWQFGDASIHRTDTVCCSNYTYGSVGPAVAINIGCWTEPGKYNWDCGTPWSLDNRLSGKHHCESQWSGRWNHWAFTKDAGVGEGSEKGRMQIFLNGVLYAEKTGAASSITGVTSFEIGSGWYGGYDGALDDFRIYDYALSAEEIAYLATDGTGVFDNPIMSPADLNDDKKVNFVDFAVLAGTWLNDHLWP